MSFLSALPLPDDISITFWQADCKELRLTSLGASQKFYFPYLPTQKEDIVIELFKICH
jgi:hypothetical protein